MKLKYLFSSLLASTMLLSGCVDVDDVKINDGAGTADLQVTGYLVEGYAAEIPSVIDEVAGTITVQVPYYISDTDPVMGDITQMKLEAQLPTGYMFSPVLSGIHDLSKGYDTYLIDPKGRKTHYSIKAEYTKSNESKVLSAILVESERTAVVIRDPETDGEHGKIVVAKTSSSVDGALHEVKINTSPWATLSCSTLDEETGYVDLSGLPEVTVVSQNGESKTVYDVEVQVPDVLDQGVGYIGGLFGFQFYTDNDLGLVKNNTTTMAVVDDYLILSNHANVADMIVLDRYSGKKVDVKVNTTGMPTDRQFRAICHDDNNHLIAASYTDNNLTQTPSEVRIFAWKDGIQNPPTSIFWADSKGSYFAAAAAWPTREMFYNVNCRGDIFSGDAVITTAVLQSYRCWFFQFKDGKPDGNLFVEYAGGVVSMWSSTNCAPMTNKPPYGYVWHTGNFRATVVCAPIGSAGGRAFAAPKSHWWAGNTHGVDYIEFNGSHLVAVSSGNDGSGATVFQRLYVADIGSAPASNSLADGFIFDSREGNAQGTSGIAGTGPDVTGMTSANTFESGKTVLGDNFAGINRAMGDVKFARSPDGNAVQVYMLTPDHGILAYEITRFDI